MPPITIYTENIKNLIKEFKLILKHNNFHIKIIHKKCAHILTQNIQDFDIINKCITDKEENHFTYTPQREKILI